MIHRKIYISFIAILTIATLFAQTIPMISNAAAPAMYFSPSSISVQNGGQLTAVVRANGTNAVAADIRVTYDSGSLEFISFSNSGSPFASVMDNGTSAGSVKRVVYTSASAPEITGDGLYLASFTFKALKGSGTSNISLASASSLTGGDENNNTITLAGGGATATVSFTSAPTSTSPATPATPKPGATTPKQPVTVITPAPTTSTTTPSATEAIVAAPSTDTTPPKVSSTQPVGYTGQPISIKVTSNEPTTATIRYGKSKDAQALNATTGSFAKSYLVPLGELSTLIKPGEAVFYTIEVVDAAGNKTTSETQQFTTSPVAVTLKVKDAKGNILANATVIINGREFTTDSKGNVTANGIIPGLVVVSLKNSEKEQVLGELTAVANKANQSFEISPAGAKKAGNNQAALALAIGSLAILVGGISGLIISRRMTPRFQQSEHAIISGDGGNMPAQTHPVFSDEAYHPQAVIAPADISRKAPPRPVEEPSLLTLGPKPEPKIQPISHSFSTPVQATEAPKNTKATDDSSEPHM